MPVGAVLGFELSDLSLHSQPTELGVIARRNLVFGGAIGQKLGHIVHQMKPWRYRHQCLLEQHGAAFSWRIRRAVVDNVLLSAVGDGSEPNPSMVPAEELEHQRLFTLRGVEVARHDRTVWQSRSIPALLVQAGIISPVSTELCIAGAAAFWARVPDLGAASLALRWDLGDDSAAFAHRAFSRWSAWDRECPSR